MFKLVVLSFLVTVAVARPGFFNGAVQVSAPIVAKTYVAPAAVSSTYREDVISKPAAVAYASAPLVARAVVAEPVAISAPVVQKAIIAAPVAYAVHAPNVYAAAAVHAW